VLDHNFWYYAVQMHMDRIVGRHGPFESEADLLAYLKHEKIMGEFDIVRSISLYSE
jgi:hypothetical protein